jgi:hypothetical protein
MLELTVRRHYYEKLMPLGYTIYSGLGASFKTPAGLTCDNYHYPFSNAPADTWVAFLDYRKGDQPPGGWNVFVVAGNIDSSSLAPGPYPPFADTLFNPYDPGRPRDPQDGILHTLATSAPPRRVSIVGAFDDERAVGSKSLLADAATLAPGGTLCATRAIHLGPLLGLTLANPHTS